MFSGLFRISSALLLGCSLPCLAATAELAPTAVDTPLGDAGPRIGTFAERTLAVAFEFDRGSARLLGYTLKPRPFASTLDPPPPRAYDDGRPVQIEVALLGPDGTRYTQRVDVGPICFSHGPEDLPHVAGDTILVHRDSFVVELPEVEGFDRIEIGYHETNHGRIERRALVTERLDRARYLAAGSSATYSDLLIADPRSPGPPPTPAATAVRWPEFFLDSDIYTVYGDLAEGDRRINVVIVPDGYTYGEKSVMQSHASAMVSHFRNKTPYAEHDPFINYILVYGYSVESGTDECDCGVVKNTAFGTRFPMQNPQCGHSDNRCLYYGGGCDTGGTSNIYQAELRAPFHDTTIVMVNTGRYGGCGGARAVYSAGVSSAVEVAVHELGHSLGGLADEYTAVSDCGTNAGEVNTSLNATDGAWAEWIEELGPPREGAQYYTQCVYRPLGNCEMRSLNQPFCPVCNQHWTLITFGHPNVSPTAPIESMTPAEATTAWMGIPADFSVETRLSAGASVTNEITWELSGPGIPEPVELATGVTGLTHTFAEEGQYTLTVEVVADTNFVKPSRYGANRESASWIVDVSELQPPPEVSSPGAVTPLAFTDRQTLVWEDGSAGGVFTYNLYRGEATGLPAGDYGSCLLQGLDATSATVADEPSPRGCWTYLVSGQNPAGEGPLGSDSDGAPRGNGAPCGGAP